MSVQLFLAPAASGKTAFALDRVRTAASGLWYSPVAVLRPLPWGKDPGSPSGANGVPPRRGMCLPRLVVPNQLQVAACRRRLAQAGGAMGVRVLTFDQLYAECLNAAGEAYTELSEPVRYRLIRAVVDQLSLVHYRPLADRPGFIQVLQGLLAELKAARISPEHLAEAVKLMGNEPRLRELALVYSAYQERLQQEGWADRAGMAWLAFEALERRAPHVATDWPLVVVDGFDDFTEVQLALLRILALRVGELVITLTGTTDGETRPLVHRRFLQTLQRLEGSLNVRAQPLPAPAVHLASELASLEHNLYRTPVSQVESRGALELVEATDRLAEVRCALRWLKQRLLLDGLRPAEVVLLARDLTPYRPHIQQTAAEMGLPVRLVGGLPLKSNPVIAALFDLLRLLLPRSTDDPGPALSRRLVVEAWRSPYFDWSALPAAAAPEAIGIVPRDAERLDQAARQGCVIAGLEQWREAFRLLEARETPSREPDDQEEATSDVPVGPEARKLGRKFERFLQRLTPLSMAHTLRDYVRWMEDLIGEDPQGEQRFRRSDDPTSLRVVARVRDIQDSERLRAAVEWDVAALQALKDVLRGLVWAEEAVAVDRAVDYPRFVSELQGTVEATSYRLPVDPRRQEILVCDVVEARGVPFRAVAVLGLAEGEFPASIREDPFLRDADRARMSQEFHLPLLPSTVSAEAEFFYETVTRASEKLLLTRPRLADNGATWEASPFWKPVLDCITVQPQALSAAAAVAPDVVASWPELMETLSAHPEQQDLYAWACREKGERCAALQASVQLLRQRDDSQAVGTYVGDLSSLSAEFTHRFGSDHVWSASRLEAYCGCPFRFFVGSVLELEPKLEPQAGLNARQLGTIYHRILELVYQDSSVQDVADVEQVLAALPRAAKSVLDDAPRTEGFRETAWWAQTREEIEDNVRRSLQALAENCAAKGFKPVGFERRFFDPDEVLVSVDEHSFRLHGVIDRVDQMPDGRVRIIDYKTAGPGEYTNRALDDGKKIQLPLYALAARALGLGDPYDGFYWHVRHAKASSFSLRGYEEKSGQDPLKVAALKAWDVVRGVQEGQFQPRRSADGCPEYCPAASFCWKYQASFGG